MDPKLFLVGCIAAYVDRPELNGHALMRDVRSFSKHAQVRKRARNVSICVRAYIGVSRIHVPLTATAYVYVVTSYVHGAWPRTQCVSRRDWMERNQARMLPEAAATFSASLFTLVPTVRKGGCRFAQTENEPPFLPYRLAGPRPSCFWWAPVELKSAGP